MKEHIKAIARGELADLTLDQMLLQLLQRKVGERVIRVSTPLNRGFRDEVPSPTNNYHANKHQQSF